MENPGATKTVDARVPVSAVAMKWRRCDTRPWIRGAQICPSERRTAAHARARCWMASRMRR